MKIDSDLYIHPSDRTALAALKAIPGFSQVLKYFMKMWDEKLNQIVNMSSYLKLSENQMAKYYNMLPPICEKLGIDVPDLYVKLDVNPNAYTYGDTNPFIVLHSGLFETVPEELIPTVIAHECGHIACHHTLYTTMGQMLLNGFGHILPSSLGNIAMYPIQLAFAYWMRCSEFSADRAAIIYDESPEKVIEMCMRFAGYDKDIMAEARPDLFIEQAKAYKELVDDNALNKTMEFMLFSGQDHPMNAVRAYEANEWGKGDRFWAIQNYMKNPDETHLPVKIKPEKFIGKPWEEVIDQLKECGFSRIIASRVSEVEDGKLKSGTVATVAIDGSYDLHEDYYGRDAEIIITYFIPKSDAEMAAEHPGEIKVEISSKAYIGKNYRDVVALLQNQGFTNIL